MFIHPPARDTAQVRHLRSLKSAFTLIEVLLAMGLIGLIIGGIYSLANGSIQLGVSMNQARISETRLTNFTTAWRDYLENLPPGIRLSCGLQKVKRGAGGNLLIEGGQVPFVWTQRVRLADAVEFALVRSEEKGGLDLLVRHLKRLEKPTAMDAYSQISELPLLTGLKEFRWEFYVPDKKRWFSSWDPDKNPVPPLFMRLHFQFLKDPREYEFTYWIANDLVPRTAGSLAPAVQATMSHNLFRGEGWGEGQTLCASAPQSTPHLASPRNAFAMVATSHGGERDQTAGPLAPSVHLAKSQHLYRGEGRGEGHTLSLIAASSTPHLTSPRNARVMVSTSHGGERDQASGPPRLIPNHTENGIRVSQHVLIRESQRANAALLQKGIANLVLLPSFYPEVLPSIQLNAKLQLSTEEVQHVRLHGVLSSKLAPIDSAISQARPQQSLGIRRLMPEQPCKLDDLQGFAGDLVMNELNTIKHAQTLKEGLHTRQASSRRLYPFVIRHSDFVI